MTTILLVIHLLIALAMVGLILIQRSEGGLGSMGGSGGGAGSGGFGGLISARGSTNFLTRTTAILATCFIATSLLLAILASADRAPRSILDAAPPAPMAPAAPVTPAPPVADQ
jgi:preprotein translocase subunit SecG